MSIKTKLALWISFIVAIILSLNISIYYYSSRTELQANAERQMAAIAKQIGTKIEVSQKGKQLLEDMVGDKLRMAAIAAQNKLDPDINKVTNDQLVQLSQALGIDHITLWKQLDNDILALKSSNSKEINLSSKTWDYWYTAFGQLFAEGNVSIPYGQKLPHYWSGPINFATSDPSVINKWGYYYDGTTNYMINPYLNAQMLLQFEKSFGTDAYLHTMLQDNSNILEITGFDPQFFGQKPIIKIKNGIPVYNLDVRDVIFGQYTFQHENDLNQIKQATQSGSIFTINETINNRQVIKSFIPINGTKPYVIGITFDQGAITNVLDKQLLLHISISVGLILITMVASYFIAGFMLRSLNQIIRKVTEVSSGNFGTQMTVHSEDELGQLASKVNTMSTNLSTYTQQLKDTAIELQETKEYLESFVNHTSDAIHVMDLQGNVLLTNKAFETIFGWSEEDTVGKQIEHIPPSYEHEFERIRQSILLGEPIADYETVRSTKDGRYIDVSTTISPIRNGQGDIVAIASISRNITLRKQTEELLRKSEKLSVVGQLAAGVAHEIRNPLTTIRGFVQLQKNRGPLATSHLDIMLSELDRINFIVSEFLVLSKPQASLFELGDVQAILRDIVLLLDSQANLNNVQIEMQVEEDIPNIFCEPNQLKQVFVNVLKNGMEAMPDGGKLLIHIEYNPAGSVIVRIIDQGHGISEEDLPRLGEPFFTNKESGNGLGLMVSQRIIANHKGSLLIQSELGKGTCVEIHLPL
ncbi:MULTISPECIES: PAS domain S-box protein [unclassified Paenibacillus]|uniref:PAS domain S-box protein n=1 Tax=unclassified Paenibacillus TaxID=185978 RepID=UPI003630E09A